jgi:predicted DNA-binding transcriptional regulator AlpA
MLTLDEPLIPPEEVAAVLHVETPTLTAWRHRGQGPRYVRVGKLVFYRSSDIRQWLNTRVTEPVRRHVVSA